MLEKQLKRRNVMDKFKKLITLPIITLLGFACVNASVSTKKTTNQIVNQFVSGVEINTSSIPIQILRDSFETDPDGPVLNQTVKIFELNNGECLSLVTLYNESGFGGYEDLVIFKENRILTSLQRTLFFSKENGAVTKADIRYDDSIDDSKETKFIINEDFNRYKHNFNSKVNSTCIK